MAQRGSKNKPSYLKLLTGTQRGLVPPEIAVDPMSDNGLQPPKKLKRREAELWDAFIKPLHWLRPVDSPIALIWVALFAEFERSPGKMIAGRIAQMRAAASELGLTPSARTRLSADGVAGRPGEDRAARYLK